MTLPLKFNTKLFQQSFKVYKEQLIAAGANTHGTHDAKGLDSAKKRLSTIQMETETANAVVLSDKNRQFETIYNEAEAISNPSKITELTTLFDGYCDEVTTQLWINVAYADQKMKTVLHSVKINVDNMIDHDAKTQIDFPLPKAQFELVMLSIPENAQKLNEAELKQISQNVAFVLMSVAVGKATDLYMNLREFVIREHNQVNIVEYMQNRFRDEAKKRHRDIYEYIQHLKNVDCNTSSTDDAETLQDVIFSCVDEYARAGEKMINEYVKEFAENAVILNYEYEKSSKALGH